MLPSESLLLIYLTKAREVVLFVDEALTLSREHLVIV